jgi:hypothetical protein
LELARSSALKAIAGEFQGDALSRLYFVWANLYGASEQAWDDARLAVQIGGESEDAMEVARRHGLFVVDGSRCRLALLNDRAERRNLGGDPDSPLIDRLHRAMLFWKEENRSELVIYLSHNELLDYEPFWKLTQALFEVLPRDGLVPLQDELLEKIETFLSPYSVEVPRDIDEKSTRIRIHNEGLSIRPTSDHLAKR